MSEKRFLLKTNKKLQIIDKEKNHRIRDMYKACEVLNELAEENEKLKKENEELEISIQLFEDDVSRLTKEVENLQSNMMESLGKHRNYEKSLEEENKRKTNEIKLLRKQYSKIPKNIRKVWKE